MAAAPGQPVFTLYAAWESLGASTNPTVAAQASIGRGERIAQLLILPIVTPALKEVDGLDETARGAKGFGSSGK